MKKILIILFIGNLFLCCSDRKNSTDSEILIDLDKETLVSISDLFESIDVIQLETHEQCLIQRIENVIFYDNKYYILDEDQQMFFCFDDAGKFLFKIDSKGQGPEEYIHIGSFNINIYEQTLLLLEPWGNLLTFDLDGKFISKIKLPDEIVAYNEVYPLNKDTLVFISLNKYALVMYSKSTESIIDKRYEDERNDCVFGPLRKTYSYNNQVFFSPPATNDVLNLSDNTVFSWNFGVKNNTQKQIKKIIKIAESGGCNMKPGQRRRRDIVGEKLLNYDIVNNYETSRYKICFLDYGNLQPRFIFLDKKTNQAGVFGKTKENIRFLRFFLSGESIVVIEQPQEYKFYDENLLSEEQRKIISSRKEDDNPLLIKYNLKQ